MLEALGPWVVRLVGLAVVMAVAFWVVGEMRGDGDEAPTAAAPTPTATATAGGPDGPTTPPATATPTPDQGATGSPSPTAPGDASIAPGEVSVQVLDAAGDDGSAAADVAVRLREAGYSVVAENQAIRNYEQTTVFYTEGSQSKARQVADQFGYPVVEPKLDNLSDTVDLHVVVGADQI